jgi:hypothetical protein
MSARRAASQLLSGRSLHLRIVPRPANLSESREIYRVLQRFGELSMFKSLRYEYHNPADNIVLAIFRDENSAQKALDASPIRFALEKVIQQPNENYANEFQGEDDDDQDSSSSLSPKTPTKNGIDEILRPSTLSTRTERAAQTPHTHKMVPSRHRPLARRASRLRRAPAVLEAIRPHQEHGAGRSGQAGAAYWAERCVEAAAECASHAGVGAQADERVCGDEDAEFEGHGGE